MNKLEISYGIKFSCITGLMAAVVYPLMITNHGDALWILLLEISFGPLFIISNIGLYYFLKQYENNFFNIVALSFNVLAGASILMTNVVQKSVFTFGRNYKDLDKEVSKEIVEQAYQVGNLTQLGMDFYWDVLVSFGTFFLALCILKQGYFNKWIGILGLLVGFGGLFLNMLTFPVPPANKNLIDPSPFYSVFFGIVLALMIYKTVKNEKI